MAIHQGALAQAAPKQPGEASELDAITVTADRAPTRIFDSPSTVSITTAKDIDQKNIHTPRDVIQEEPGVTVPNQAGRGGAANYNIRGLGENRVRVQVDGVKLPDFPGSNFGAGTVYTRDFVDYDSLKQIEIIRGPASALYGSDALGGVVSFVTKDPSDYLRIVNKNWYLSGKTGYDSADRSFSQTVTGAGSVGAWESLVLYTHRTGKELSINSYRAPNPQDYESHNFLGKIVYNSPDFGQFKLTGEYFYKSTDANILTDLASTVRDSRGEDNNSRPRISFDWNLPVTWMVADAVKTNLYWTQAQRQEFTTQLRSTTATGPTNTVRASDFGYQQSIAGGELQLSLNRSWLGWQHNVVYGSTYDFTQTTRPRYRTQTTNGVSTNVVGGETFPNKNFPDTDTTQAAIYLQDTAQYGAWRIIPALRLDYYHLEPKPDRLSGNSALGANFIQDSITKYALSPKLGTTYDLNDNYRLVAQYSHGFRAPPYDNANFAFSNATQGYQIIPNNNLKPETSDSFEAGLRGRFENGSSFALTGYYNMYRNFIDTKTLSSPPATPLIVFQYQNLSRVRIFGFEAKGDYKLTPELSVFASFAYANGADETTEKAINSVDPFTFVTGLRYDRPDGWGGEIRGRFVAAQNRVNSATVFRTPGYATIDTLVHYTFNKNFTINAGVYNILNEKYFNHADVAGFLKSNANLELYRSPGRTFAVNATVQF